MKAGPLKDAGVAEAAKGIVMAVIDSAQSDNMKWFKEFDIRGIPAMVFIRPDGEELNRIRGFVDAKTLTSAIEEATE